MLSGSFNIDTPVSFALGDVIAPSPVHVLQQIGPQLRLSGRVTLLSSGDAGESQYAVVQVDGIAGPLVVPVSYLSELVFVEDPAALECGAPDTSRVLSRTSLQEVDPAPPGGGTRVLGSPAAMDGG